LLSGRGRRAAVILAASDIAETFTEEPIPVLGSGHATGRSAAYRYDDLTTFEATSIAAESAYEQADVRPSDIDVVELHDCFSAAEVGDSEDLGFFEKGNGAAAVEAGRTAVDGEIPINPSGGSSPRGIRSARPESGRFTKYVNSCAAATRIRSKAPRSDSLTISVVAVRSER